MVESPDRFPPLTRHYLDLNLNRPGPLSSLLHMSSIAALPQHFRPFSPSQSYSVGYPRRNIPPPLSLRKLKDSTVAQETNPYSGGLRTPPAEDEMSATYHNTMVAGNTYESHVALARHPNNILPSSRVSTSTVIFDTAVNPYSRSQTHSQPPPQLLTTYALRPPGAGASRPSTQSPAPTASTGTLRSHSSEGTISGGEDQSMVMHSLKLPKCISSNGGSLDDFSALVSYGMLNILGRAPKLIML